MQRLARLALIRTEREYHAPAQVVADGAFDIPFRFTPAIVQAESIDTLKQLSFERGDTERMQVRNYVLQGETFVALVSGNHVAARGLIRHTGHLSLEALQHARPLADHEHFIHYCRTAHNFAGNGLYRHILVSAARFVSTLGPAENLSITCNDQNIASIKGIERTGFLLKHRILTIGFAGGRFGIRVPRRVRGEAE